MLSLPSDFDLGYFCGNKKIFFLIICVFLAGQLLQTLSKAIKMQHLAQKMFSSVCPVNLQWENKLKNAAFSPFYWFCGKENTMCTMKTPEMKQLTRRQGGVAQVCCWMVRGLSLQQRAAWPEVLLRPGFVCAQRGEAEGGRRHKGTVETSRAVGVGHHWGYLQLSTQVFSAQKSQSAAAAKFN